MFVLITGRYVYFAKPVSCFVGSVRHVCTLIWSYIDTFFLVV